jgi:hypothetical protein
MLKIIAVLMELGAGTTKCPCAQGVLLLIYPREFNVVNNTTVGTDGGNLVANIQPVVEFTGSIQQSSYLMLLFILLPYVSGG